MNRFERRLANELERVAGPRRPVDARAIRQAAQGRTGRTWPALTGRIRRRPSGPGAGRVSMAASLRLVAAVVIVALFGGLMLVGLLGTSEDEPLPAAVTAAPSPTSNEDALRGATVEAVEPGVLRVLDDGAGHVTDEMGIDHRTDWVVYAGPDGSIWIKSFPGRTESTDERPVAALWRLGEPGAHVMSPDGFPDGHDFATAPDGTLWVAGWSHLASFDGMTWATHVPEVRASTSDETEGCPHSVGVEILPDGTVWATWCDRSGWLEPDGWRYAAKPTSGYYGAEGGFAAMPDGSVVTVDGRGRRAVVLDPATWQAMPILDEGVAARVSSVRIASDGTVWAHLISRPDKQASEMEHADYEDWWRDGAPEDHLAWLDGEDWSVISNTDGLPRISHKLEWGPEWDVGPDGSLWVLSDPQPSDYRGLDPDDLTWTLRRSIDGTTWDDHGDDFGWLRVGPDGTVWAGRSDERRSGDYAERLHLASFDGQAWRAYEHVEHPKLWGGFDIGPDGAAAVIADGGLYVIRPQAPSIQ